ncbi:MAG: aminotransferase class I/II-fold pyridoxal phosphate-dependent enzyme, partial [Synergistaceae bacterium]|nr:aminotransferase class I/II-fold pyridoxal phosphate-dependent enzyme [Synergistaceae bacterium]
PSYYKDVKGRTIFIANPNAPTSLAMSLSEIEEILSSNPESLVVIDEAYVDFGAESAVTLLPEHDNLVITRTFSKSRSLAGARLGWCMTSEEIAKDIKDIKNTLTPYNINAMTQAAGLGALDDEEYTRRNIDMIRMVRDNTKSRLREMGFDVMDSSTNFLFAKHETVSGEEIFNTLKKYRIMIRHFSNPPAIADYNRITIGTPEQMQIFLEVTKGIIKQ